jgi:hypothetical protein
LNCASQYCGTVVSERSTLLGITSGTMKSITERRSAIMYLVLSSIGPCATRPPSISETSAAVVRLSLPPRVVSSTMPDDDRP